MCGNAGGDIDYHGITCSPRDIDSCAARVIMQKCLTSFMCISGIDVHTGAPGKRVTFFAHAPRACKVILHLAITLVESPHNDQLLGSQHESIACMHEQHFPMTQCDLSIAILTRGGHRPMSFDITVSVDLIKFIPFLPKFP